MTFFTRPHAPYYLRPFIPGLVIFSVAIYIFFHTRLSHTTSVEYLPFVKPSDLLAPKDLCLGTLNSSNKLVVFVDYQCPYCIAEWKTLKALSNQNKHLAVYIKQLPLSSIHSSAMPAAIAAKVAQVEGEYATMTDLLFTISLSPKAIEGAKTTLQISKQAAIKLSLLAKLAVKRDQELAKRLGVFSTPSIFLIRGSGEVIRIINNSYTKELVNM